MTGSSATPDRPRAAGGGAGPIEIRIEATDLPGREWGPGGDTEGYRNIHVAVQRRSRVPELLEPHPGDAPRVLWTLPAIVTPTQSGLDITGPYVQGRPGGRFIYLSWGTLHGAGGFSMFRRAKLMFDAVEPATLDAAAKGGRLTARLTLTDAKGGPLCAAVRPPVVEWSASQA